MTAASRVTHVQWILAGCLVCWAAASSARIVPLGPPVQVNTSTPVPWQCPQVVGLADGGFVVSWYAGGEPFGRHFDAAGEPVGPEFRYEGVSAFNRMAATGHEVTISWLRGDCFMLGRFTADGTPVGPAQCLDEAVSILGYWSFAVTLQRESIILWDTFPIERLLAVRVDANLNVTGPTISVPTERSLFLGSHQVASTNEGGFIAAWIDRSTTVWARRFDLMDRAAGDPFPVVALSGLAYLVQGPAICVAPTDEFVMAWEQDDRPIALRRYGVDGQSLTEPLNTALEGVLGISLVCLPRGRVLTSGFAYLGFRDGRPSIGGIPSNSPALAIRAFDAQNRPIGQAIIPPAACSPQLAPLSNETFVAAWNVCTGSVLDGVCDNFAQRFAIVGDEDCPGDCNADGAVTVDELLTAVHIALHDDLDEIGGPAGCHATALCPAIETDLDCRVTVAEIVAAVHRALEGCQ